MCGYAFTWTEEGPTDVEIVDYHLSYCDPQLTAHPGEVLSEELLSHSSQLDQLDMVAPWSRM
jgi:hypothetical protein